MKTRKLWNAAVLLSAITFLLQFSAISRAQDDQAQYDDQSQDPPGRVARLNYSQGSISFRPAGEDDWVAGVPNRPIITGDDLWADEDSLAEVHVGSAAIRLGSKTGITFLELDDHTTQIRLAQGELIVNARHVDDDDTYEIDTPSVALTLLQPGEYRIDVSEDGSQTITTVFHGRGRVTGGGYKYTVVAGQSATFTGGDQIAYDLQQLPAQDDFDAWAFDRDQSEDDADSANYVSREMTGYEDLDESGDWTYVAGYGPCWAPRAVPVGWAPYRFGHWIWIAPWGWTWVANEPWGFAPYHYGRWAFENNRWFWVPGPVVVRPVWAPALVAFVGGTHFSAGIAWFPLAPGEVYLPGYRVSRAYATNINITNTNVNNRLVTNLYNTVIVNKTAANVTYVNQHVAGGVTVVSHDTFVNARAVGQNLVKVDAHEIASAPVSHIVAAEPIRSSVLGTGTPVKTLPPAAVMSRPVVAVRTPPPPPPSIAQRQAQAGGHLNQQTLVRPAGASQPAQNRTPADSNGFRPFTAPGGNSQVKQMPQTQPRTFEQQGSSESSERDDHNGQVWNRNPQTGARDYSQPRQPSSRSTNPAPSTSVMDSHPLVRPAPPVQERNDQQERQQAQKFNQWQQQRPAASTPAPKPAPAPRPAPAPAAHSESSKK